MRNVVEWNKVESMAGYQLGIMSFKPAEDDEINTVSVSNPSKCQSILQVPEISQSQGNRKYSLMTKNRQWIKLREI